jgi:hypothetical protein
MVVKSTGRPKDPSKYLDEEGKEAWLCHDCHTSGLDRYHFYEFHSGNSGDKAKVLLEEDPEWTPSGSSIKHYKPFSETHKGKCYVGKTYLYCLGDDEYS